MIIARSRNSSVGIVTRLRTVRSKDCGSIPGWSKDIYLLQIVLWIWPLALSSFDVKNERSCTSIPICFYSTQKDKFVLCLPDNRFVQKILCAFKEPESSFVVHQRPPLGSDRSLTFAHTL